MITVLPMTDHDMQKMKNDDRTFPGPKLFLVSGYDEGDLETLRTFLDSAGFEDVAVKCCTAEQINDSLENVLNGDTIGEPVGSDRLPCTMLFSGLTPADVKQVMSQFKDCGLQRPIFATTTPTNLTFSLKELLLHLIEEQKAAMGNRPNRAQAGQ